MKAWEAIRRGIRRTFGSPEAFFEQLEFMLRRMALAVLFMIAGVFLLGAVMLVSVWFRESEDVVGVVATRSVIGVAAVGTGLVLFRIKQRWLLWYARLEGAVAVALIADTLRADSVASVTTGLKLFGAVYLIVRALDNAEKAKPTIAAKMTEQ